MYECLRDAEFRLVGTVVQYEGKYIRVEEVISLGGQYRLRATNSTKYIPLAHKSLLIKNIKTGYININGAVSYLSRLPTRRYRQGLRSDNCEVSQGTSARTFFYWVDGGCPHVELKVGSSIISKDFAVVRNVLYYRTRVVGACIGGTPRLNNQHQFLKEALERAISLNSGGV